MERTAGDGCDSPEDSGSSQPFPATLHGIRKVCHLESLANYLCFYGCKLLFSNWMPMHDLTYVEYVFHPKFWGLNKIR
jgi:hypothetical protein